MAGSAWASAAFRCPLRYLVGMSIDRLTTEQAKKIKDALGPATGYLWRLVARLVKVGLHGRNP
jgi:hypothetical protein